MLAMLVFMVLPMPVLAQPPLNGDVEVDFPSGPGVLIIPDAIGDVGLPINAPPGTISGWDMKDLRLYYDVANDTMYVGINVGSNASTILGDADGNGNPAGTSAWLALNGGTDLADLSSSETAAVFFDLDSDGTYDVIGLFLCGQFFSTYWLCAHFGNHSQKKETMQTIIDYVCLTF